MTEWLAQATPRPEEVGWTLTIGWLGSRAFGPTFLEKMATGIALFTEPRGVGPDRHRVVQHDRDRLQALAQDLVAA
jgi:hypothetical protein